MEVMSTTAAPVDIGTLITRSPEIKGGNPRVAGTGVTVQRIVGWYKQGLNAEEIAREIGHVTAGQVYAALAYYHANTDEIERLLAEEESDYDRLCAEFSQKRLAGA
jgi:uncharacterized protein (DUF433 family)